MGDSIFKPFDKKLRLEEELALHRKELIKFQDSLLDKISKLQEERDTYREEIESLKEENTILKADVKRLKATTWVGLYRGIEG